MTLLRMFLARAAAGLLLLSSPGIAAATECSNGVTCNQDYINSISADPGFAIDSIPDVFGHVFASLPERVTVYPTENYFYFTFGYNGLVYAGNMRLDVKDRDAGVLHFAYFNKTEDWNFDLLTQYRPLTAADGVKVEKVEDLLYRVTFRGKSTLFALNDLGDVAPPPDQVAAGEEYLGPVFDESGVQFYLLFHRADKRFMFVLNEAAPKTEELMPYSDGDPSILIGMRTGFAFYQDRYQDRKILVGVYVGNVDNNNYFDGPFDQLPDNFLAGDTLKNAILAVYPDLEGQIDRLGNFVGHEGRFLVNPYTNYLYLNELEAFRRCGDAQLTRVAYYDCLQPFDEQ